MSTSSYTVQEIADRIGGTVVGAAGVRISGPAELTAAEPGQLTFIAEARYAQRWQTTKASAALVSRSITLEPGPGRALIRVDDADLAMADALALFAPPRVLPAVGVHASAAVDPSATLGRDVRIGPGCVVGPGVVLGDGAVLHANVTLLDHVQIGADTVLWPGVVIRERCIVGDRCVLEANVSIGADGFGYRPRQTGAGIELVKIPQIGIVRIGSDVEIGAGSAIDRAKFDATVIGDGCKIDNLVQIGHNCRLGRLVIIAGCTAVAGSVTIGDGAVVGGMVAIKDHLTIGPGAKIAGGAQLMNDVPAGTTVGGSPAMPIGEAYKTYAAFRHLPEIWKKVRKL